MHHLKRTIKNAAVHTDPGRGRVFLVVNFCKECGELRKKKIFTAYYLHLFALNAVNRCEISFLHEIKLLISFMPSTSYFSASTVTFVYASS